MKLNETGIWLGGGVGLLLTLAVTFSSFQYLKQMQLDRFQEQAEQLDKDFSNYLVNIKESIRFTATTLNIAQDKQSVQLPMDYSDAIVYAPMLRHSKRRAFVERMREDGFINFDIINGHKPSDVHPEYLPITRIEPFDVEHIALLGVDLLNREDTRASILSASESADISIVQAKLLGGKPHYWMFKAIYSGTAGQNEAYFMQHKMEMLNGVVGFQLAFPSFLNPTMLASSWHTDIRLEAAGIRSAHAQPDSTSLFAGHLRKQFVYPVDSTHHLKLTVRKDISWSMQMVWILLLVATFGMMITWLLMRSSQAVIRSDLRKKNILDSAFEGVISFNDAGKIQGVNPAASVMLATLQATQQQKIHEIFKFKHFDTEGYASFGDFLQRQDCLNKPIELTVRKDKSKHVIECSISSFEERSKLHFTMFMRDITVRKINEEERAKLAVIVEQSFNAIVLTDCDGLIVYVNPAFEQMSGYSSLEVIGKSPNIIKSNQHDKAYYKQMWDTLLRGDSWKGNFINKAKDGHLYEVEQSIFPIFASKDSEIIGYTAIQQDVTERNRLQQQDEHAQRLESLGVLAGGIAHDFNNLLTAIMGNASLAKRNLGNSQACEKKLDNILHASESAASLCKQMLAYSGKGHFIIHPMNLSEEIDSILQLLETSVSKKAKLHVELDNDLALIEADEAQMQQVLMNLVINAAEAMEQGSGDIFIRTKMDYLTHDKLAGFISAEGITEGDYVVVEVCDNGCGMDEETQKKIFDPFFTTKFTGRGLGMSAILGIIRGHHGALQMQSVLGKGTEFRVYFPALKASTVHVQEPNKDDSKSIATELTVLVVDDEDDVRNLAGDILDVMGMHSMLAESGERGLELLKQHLDEIDVVLLDMTMPGMDGQQFYDEMQGFAAHIPVIISSGYSESDIRQRFEDKLGSNALALSFLKKPYHPELLQQKIQDVVIKH